ncbi:hypothetical protein ACI8HA_003721, partial [Vibrio cholerae]
QKLTHKVLKIQHLAFKLHNLAFGVFLIANLVESVESSVVSQLLITNKLRLLNVVGCSTRIVWFPK